jgi:hypothetical protein
VLRTFSTILRLFPRGIALLAAWHAAAQTRHAPTKESFQPRASTPKICSAPEREEIRSSYESAFKELRLQQALHAGTKRLAPARSPKLEALRLKLRALLADRDPQTCVRDANLNEQNACWLVSSAEIRFDSARKSFKGDAVLNRERLTVPSERPGLDYVRTWNPKTGDYSSLVMLVDRDTQSVVGTLDERNGLSLDRFGFRKDTREVRGHTVATLDPTFERKSYAFAQLATPSPLGLGRSCFDASAGLDRFLSDAAAKEPSVAAWDPQLAAITGYDKFAAAVQGGKEGLEVGSINLYESGKGVYDGVKFFVDYLADTKVDSPFEPGQKIGYRAMIHESLGEKGRDAFESCLKDLCPGQNEPSVKSCGLLAGTRATSCVGAKIAQHFGKEIADYVVGCFTGTSRQDEGLSSGAESLSACLADVSVVTASAIPGVGAAKGVSAGGQTIYKSMLTATKSLSPPAKKFLRNATKRGLRLGAGTTVAAIDLTINQLPTSPNDLKHLQTYLTSYLDNPLLARTERTRAQELLKRVVDARHGQPSHTPDLSRDALKAELERAYKGSDLQWYKDSFQADLDQALVERANLQRYLDEGLKPGEQVFWMQQGSLKELNEKLWDIGGTEYYLMTLDRELGKLLKEKPELGRMVHRNYKDRVVVSSLSLEDFEKRVLGPLRERVATQVSAMKQSLGTTYLWEDYMQDAIKVGRGASIEDSFLNLHLGRSGRNFEEWKGHAARQRKALDEKIRAKRPGETLEHLLASARKLRDDPQKLSALMKKSGLPADFGDDLLDYIQQLRLADFLPMAKPLSDADRRVVAHSLDVLRKDPANPLAEIPRIESVIDDSWIFQRSRFLKEAQGSRYMVATDLQGLGEKALMAQDKWLAEGADPKTLPKVYEQTTQFLDGRYDHVAAELRAVLGPHATLGVYRSGDDALWSLPEMTIEQKAAVDAIFAAQKDMYSAVVEVNSQAGAAGVADAVHGAREKLFSDKAVLKKSGSEGPQPGPAESSGP